MEELTHTSRYMNPLTDYGFKRIFGDEEIMRAFLTDLLQPKSPITTIKFLDKDMGAEYEYERGVIYDLRCKTEDGGEFIVEMQNRNQMHFSDRIVYYLSRSISMQKEQDHNWDYKLAPVYGIFFLNFHLSGLENKAVRSIQLKVNETGEVFSDKIKAFTLELPDFKDKAEDYPKEKIEYWMYNLINMETMTQNIPYQDKQPIFMKMGNISELSHLNERDRRNYETSLNIYRTNKAVMAYERYEGMEQGLKKGLEKGMEEGMKKGREEGMKEGREEGMKEGMKQATLANAKNLKENGIPAEVIAKSLCLSIDEVNNL